MRPPSVFVRPLLHEEAIRLKRLSRRAKHECTRQRAAVLLASNVLMPVAQIAEMWRTDPSWVRKVIHEFNERGMGSLRPRYRGGRPRRITTEQRQRIVSVAGARPDSQGVPLTRWSLPLLAVHLGGEGIVVSPRHLGTLLAEAGLLFQREAGRSRHAQLHAPDPARLPGTATDLLDPGQPLGQLGAANSCLRRREQDRACRDPDRRQLPQPGRVPLLCADRGRVANADYLDWDAFGYALARHVCYRNSDHRDQRIAAAEQRHRIAA